MFFARLTDEGSMDKIERALRSIVWEYADKDLAALEILKARIVNKGQMLGVITYSDLVQGVIFHYPNINNGAPYEIRTWDWTGLDRRIIGDCLGYISMESYINHGFMASALVVNKDEYKPSPIFFEWMKSLNILENLKEETVMAFWGDQINKAHNWYKSGRKK